MRKSGRKKMTTKKKKKNYEGNSDYDRFSALPDNMIHQIFSFLDMKQVVQTCVLSKKWRYVWKSLPYLNINSDQFLCSNTGILEGFQDFMDKVLECRDTSVNIERFHFSCCGMLDHEIAVEKDHPYKWILTALTSKVKDICLDILRDDFHLLPDCLFTCKTLEKLELHCHFYTGPLLFNMSDDSNLPKLKTLVLSGFQFEEKHITKGIFSSYPVLESLSIIHCALSLRLTSLDIVAPPQLKHLVMEIYVNECEPDSDHESENEDEFEDDDRVKPTITLSAPNLVSFCCNNYMWSNCSTIDLSTLCKAEIGIGTETFYKDEVLELDDRTKHLRTENFLISLKNVETLTLSDTFLKVVSRHPDLLELTNIEFHNLRFLKLQTLLSRGYMKAIKYLLEISPNIESLLLDIKEDGNGMQPEHSTSDNGRFKPAEKKNVQKSADINVQWKAKSLQYLKDVKIQGAQGRHEELVFLKSLLKKAMVLENVALYTPNKEQSPQKKQQQKIVKQLRASARAASNTKFKVV